MGLEIWSREIEIPTYEVGPEDRNPPFLKPGRWKIYPYAVQDHLTGRKKPKRYNAVFSENEYLRLIILPEVGGRLYSALDKVTGKEVFYRNHVIKTARIALRGAWFAGGVEFNFPNGHTVTTISPVSYLLRKRKDHVSVTIGDIEYSSRMRWSVTITLRSGTKLIEVEVKLYNRTSIPNRYWFWMNAATYATEGLRFIVPAKRVFISDSGTYPSGRIILQSEYVARDLDRYISWDDWAEVFGLEPTNNFFGWYDDVRGLGCVHIANVHEVEGRKMFTWGKRYGVTWTERLTDEDGPYCEFQSGRFQTQREYEMMSPRFVECWREYWYPVTGIGGFVYANRDAVLNLEPSQDGVILSINVTRKLPKSRILVSSGEERILDEALNLSPDEPLRRELTGLTGDLMDKPLTIKIFSEDGYEIISYVKPPAQKEKGKVCNAREVIKSARTAEELYLKGVYLEKLGEDLKAEKFYRDALDRDPYFSQAHLALGTLYYKRGLFEEALEEFKAALKRLFINEKKLGFVSRLSRYPNSGLVHYFMGLTYKELEDYEKAEEEFWKLIVYRDYAPLGYYFLGETSIIKGNFEEAESFLRKSISLNSEDVKSVCMLAAVLRRRGKVKDAFKVLKDLVEKDPTCHLARSELFILGRMRQTQKKVKEERRILDNLLYKGRMRAPVSIENSPPSYYRIQHYLELATDYGNAGLYDEASEILRMALEAEKTTLGIEDCEIYPLIYYYLGYYLEKMGSIEEAFRFYRLGGEACRDHVFPFRLESLKVLKQVLRHYPRDARARYYLGNLLFSNGRFEEAMEEWNASVRIEADFDVIHRNLGLAYWKVKGNIERAMEHYRKAISCNPYNVRLYVELDDLYEEKISGRYEERLRIIKQAPQEVLEHDYVISRLVNVHINMGKYDEALKLLREHTFHPWEVSRYLRNLYVEAHIGKGIELLKHGKFVEAINYFSDSMKYPRNIGIGEPSKREDSMALYWIGVAYKKLRLKEKSEDFWKKGAREKHGTDSALSYFSAMCLKELGRHDEAREILKRIKGHAEKNLKTETDPTKIAAAHYLKGLAYKGMEKTEKAVAEFREVLNLLPNHKGARRELGLLL